ncbi:MAG: cytochrome c peroxidase [Parvicellaceae bacterium]
MAGLLFAFVGCEFSDDKPKAKPIELTEFIQEIPVGFPEIDYPQDNLPTAARIKLGKRLFNDPILSRNRTVACASCHLESVAFSDTVSLSLGEFGRTGVRNSPSLHNVAYLPYLFKDGGIPNLELQIKAPIEDSNEMNFNMKDATIRVAEDSTYQKLALEAYNRQMDAFVITRSLAAFMRTFISGNSKFDIEARGEYRYTEKEKEGFDLFFGDIGKCSECHNGFNLTNNSFENNGSKSYYADTGRARITMNHVDHGKFRVPSLRNVGITGPYFYDGSYNQLNDVLKNYGHGGSGHWNQNNIISTIHLTDSEQNAIIAFLHTLTDESFVNSNNTKE